MEYIRILDNKIDGNIEKIRELESKLISLKCVANSKNIKLITYKKVVANINKTKKEIEELEVYNKAYEISLKMYKSLNRID